MIVVSVAIIIAVIASLVGYVVFQHQEIRAANRNIATLLTINARLEIENDTLDLKVQANRMVLGLALRQNMRLKRDNADLETSVLLAMSELERVS